MVQRHGALRARLAPAPQSGRRFWQATVVKTLRVCEVNLFVRVFEQGLYIAMTCNTCSYCKSCDCSLMDVRYISCDHQDDMISSSFESLIESKQSVPPVSILELLRVFENCLTSRAVWLARN